MLFVTRSGLEQLYAEYNRREFVHPDPLEFLYPYSSIHDREIVGLISSSLAYGRVRQILRSVSVVLDGMGRSPSDYLLDSSEDTLRLLFSDFKHRFTTGTELVELLTGAREVVKRHGSLGACFRAGLRSEHRSVLPALDAFVGELGIGERNSLLPSPDRGSACKRLNLFLRWMVRRDDVDVGGWEDVPASKLIVPVDTHIHRIGLALGFTRKKCANMDCAIEITEAFKRFAPEDPVRYDFALTRLGMMGNGGLEAFLDGCRRKEAVT